MNTNWELDLKFDMFYKNMFILLSETGLHERCLFKSWRSCCKKSSVKDDLTGAPSLEQDCLAASAAGGYGKPLGRRVLLDPTSITRLTTGQTVKQKTYLHINTISARNSWNIYWKISACECRFMVWSVYLCNGKLVIKGVVVNTKL